jgi:GT2 family glycosyltransferase
MSKIGIGIITCNRPMYLKRLAESLLPVIADKVIVVNDGEYNNDWYIASNDAFTYHMTPPKQGVAKAKNKALKYLLNEGCEYIFLIEDDIIIKDKNIFNKYIEASKLTGIQHFNFAFHGNDNYLPNGTPAVRLKVEYNKDIAVCFYPNVYGAFSFYTRECLKKVGLMDEEYYNAMEHVDHTYFIAQAGMTTPFRWFADIADSNRYIEELDTNHSGSEIRRDEKWITNFQKAVARFTKKSKINVTGPTDVFWTKEQTIDIIKQIKKNYGKK